MDVLCTLVERRRSESPPPPTPPPPPGNPPIWIHSSASASYRITFTDWCAALVKVLASPAVRKLGKDHNINLATISGSGPKGRILKADILRIVRGREEPPTAATATAFAHQVATGAAFSPAVAGAAGMASGQSTKKEDGAKAPLQSQVQSSQYTATATEFPSADAESALLLAPASSNDFSSSSSSSRSFHRRRSSPSSSRSSRWRR